mmetsp:Transcript_31565/g.75014  ORF Transcript_31565/g.75014 Transcript_31565/m.75014 type:complete len:221 (-) Transcript_31565:129-791(-)
MEVRTSLCCCAKRRSSGTRIMSPPSSVVISTSAPAGEQPARRARSTDASVCPSRASTPPGTARRGKMWPGRERSEGSVLASARARSVAARSAAEMPVVMPALRSVETVNAVHLASSFLATMSGSRSASARAPSIAQQITPDEYLIMKARVALVAFSAAMMKSPSFSRSSSSTTHTTSPRPIAAMASSTDDLPKHHTCSEAGIFPSRINDNASHGPPGTLG